MCELHKPFHESMETIIATQNMELKQTICRSLQRGVSVYSFFSDKFRLQERLSSSPYSEYKITVMKSMGTPQ
jgi:hypothetical protein